MVDMVFMHRPAFLSHFPPPSGNGIWVEWGGLMPVFWMDGGEEEGGGSRDYGWMEAG